MKIKIEVINRDNERDIIEIYEEDFNEYEGFEIELIHHYAGTAKTKTIFDTDFIEDYKLKYPDEYKEILIPLNFDNVRINFYNHIKTGNSRSYESNLNY